MKTATLIKRAGESRPRAIENIAKALDITTQAVYRWKAEVPILREFQLRELRPEWFPSKRG